VNREKAKARPNKWDEAIADAKRKIAGLRMCMSVFEIRKAAGDP